MHQTDVLTPAATREKAMADRGRRRAEETIAKSIERGEIAETPAGLKLVSRELAALSDAIRDFVTDAMGGSAGNNNTTAKFLKDINPDLAAFITIRASLGAAVEQYHLKTLARNVAATLELELLADAFAAQNTALYNAIVRRAKEKGLTPQRIAKAVELANRHFEIVPQLWGVAEKLQIGTKLVELFVRTSNGLIQAPLIRLRNGRSAQIIQFGEGVTEWIEHIHDRAVLSRPMWLPTLDVPKPWETVRGGGYATDFIRAPSIVSKPFGGQLKALREAVMPDVYEGLNGIQETPWRVNQRVLAVMREAWDKSLPLPAVPARDDLPLPPKPEDIATNTEARKAYSEAARAVHQRNAGVRSDRFVFARTLDIAQENAGETFYFPHRLDFRGRCYAMSTALHPQGPDECRALLEFAEGKPLGERGLFWLGVHGANVFGNDKVSLQERFAWATQSDVFPKVEAVAADPLSNLWWTEADKPWSFLAWCFEWADACYTPGYVSHLPIALDGSCNGIQHYSAMLRDEVGGAAVNLVPSDKPQDIYQEVADRVKEKLASIAGKFDHPDHFYAYQWDRFGIDRKITKRAVMVLPYGGTFKSCMDYVADATDERFAAGQEQPFGDRKALRKAQGYLAKLVWESIGEVVIKSREAMKWLQAVARVCTEAGVPIQWTTPTGFIVKQDYRKPSDRRITTRFAGSVVKFCSVEDTDVIDGAKQASALPPNVIHSLDASAMMRTIVAARSQGIRSFAMIHDSYGTHAADTEGLSQILRECFVGMYAESNFLEHFRDEVVAQLPLGYAEKIPPLPKQGALDLSEVRNSDYFFA